MHTNDNRKPLLFRVLLLVQLILLAPTAAHAETVGSLASKALAPAADFTYTVKANDTLWDIAAAHNISVAALQAANPALDPKYLQKGQVLIIPGQADAGAQPAAAMTYTVRANDTLWDIAMSYGVSVNALMAANPGVDPQRLQNGQTLIIPDAEGAAAAVAGAASTPYTVRQDDTLWTIAAGFGISVESLSAANPGLDPKLLRVGQVLTVPGVYRAAVLPAPAPVAADEAVVDDEAIVVDEAAVVAEEPAAEAPPAAEIAPAPVGVPAEYVDAANQLLAWINEKRAANGIHPLVWNAELTAAAQAHANDCAARNMGSHVGSDGARLADRLARVGYPAATQSENWANSRSVRGAFDMWWNEPNTGPHRRNILWNRYTEIGIGIAKGGWGYYVIADFGSR
ncbi:MAG: D-gamma-glutamyl-meso-diaminopimelic acid endopeptidase CwlS precursor [Chloroflexi bacterium ADurb.Bin325]|nr:MAG: D-gamma-glutamyl-meso-diaminopimelic acid endopeptidase CwlS precursor [Chloroflexi bacterium ADurb.Bin325]